MEIERKTLSVQFKTVDEAQGIIEAIVSVFSVVDGVNERILPGFFTDSLEAKMPKGVWMHDWTLPVAKTLDARELMPGDPLLPAKVQAFGGLYVKAQFNLATQRGREAFSDLQFGSVDEFSIGYLVEKSQMGKNGVRDLLKGQLFEWSPVLVGCNPATALIGTKEQARTKEAGMDKTKVIKTKSQYLGQYVEGEMTYEALSVLTDALFYDVFYDAVYGSWEYTEGEGYALVMPAMEDATATLQAACEEFTTYVLRAYQALMALPGADAVKAAAAIKAHHQNPDRAAHVKAENIKAVATLRAKSLRTRLDMQGLALGLNVKFPAN